MQRILSHNTKSLLVALLLICAAGTARAQFLDSSSGLMLAPSGDMNPSGTFMLTNSWLNPNVLPPFPWGYHTFGYGFNITFWSRFEFAYVLTLIDGSKMADPPTNWWRVMKNQDRHFYAKIQLLKEGEFGQNWIPGLAIGVSDPVTGAVNGEYSRSWEGINDQNGYFNRFFVAASKHFSTPIGEIGAHIGYQTSLRTDRPVKGLCGGINFRPGWKWINNDWIKFNIIGEYDSRTFNAGLVTTLYKDHFDVLVMWQNLQWFSVSARFKIVLF